MTDKSQTKSSKCTALIIHPTFEKGILSAIIPSFQKERNILITFHNRKPKLYVIKQEGRGANDNVGLVSWPSGIYLAKYFAIKCASLLRGSRVPSSSTSTYSFFDYKSFRLLLKTG